MATLQEPFTALPEDLRPESEISRTPPRSFHSISGTPETRQSSSRDSKSSPPSHRSARKQPSYEESALRIHSSPPLTSFLNDRHSASSAQEEAYLKHASRLRVVRFILSFLTIGIAGAAVGVTAHTLKTYNDTRLGKNWHLPLWPIDIDIKPTLGVLVPASIAAISSLIYVLVALVPSPRSKASLLTPLYLLSTLTTLLSSIFTIVYTPTLTFHTDPTTPTSPSTLLRGRETLHSFTCRLSHSASSFNDKTADMGIPMFGSGMSAPKGFRKMCIEAEVGMGLMVAVCALSLLGMIVAVVGWKAERRIERGRQERWGEKYGEEKRAGTGAYPMA